MKIFGIALLVLGLIALIIGFNIDTTVATSSSRFSDRVHNIGLMNEKQNVIIFSIAMLIIGAFFVSRTGLSRTRKCPFCAEPIKIDAKICRYCHNELPKINQQLLDQTNRNYKKYSIIASLTASIVYLLFVAFPRMMEGSLQSVDILFFILIFISIAILMLGGYKLMPLNIVQDLFFNRNIKTNNLNNGLESEELSIGFISGLKNKRSLNGLFVGFICGSSIYMIFLNYLILIMVFSMGISFVISFRKMPELMAIYQLYIFAAIINFILLLYWCYDNLYRIGDEQFFAYLFSVSAPLIVTIIFAINCRRKLIHKTTIFD